MGQTKLHPPVLLLLAAFSRYPAALAWARQRAAEHWGPVALESPVFAFDQTEYYEPSMGPGLQKVFFTFQSLRDPAELPAVKRLTNAWEQEYASAAGCPEPRPLNLDPGYLTLAKLVLASTKDHAHRVYLGDGIYAEVTLHYTHGQWQAREWTFADYRRTEYHAFLTQCREYLYARRREADRS